MTEEVIEEAVGGTAQAGVTGPSPPAGGSRSTRADRFEAAARAQVAELDDDVLSH